MKIWNEWILQHYEPIVVGFDDDDVMMFFDFQNCFPRKKKPTLLTLTVQWTLFWELIAL